MNISSEKLFLAQSTLGCVFPMVAVCILLHAEFGSNHHREDAPHFIKPSIDWRMKAADFEHILKVNLDDKLAKVSWSHFLRFFTANKSFVVTEIFL